MIYIRKKKIIHTLFSLFQIVSRPSYLTCCRGPKLTLLHRVKERKTPSLSAQASFAPFSLKVAWSGKSLIINKLKSQAAFHVGPSWAPVGQSWAPNGPRMGLTGAHLGMLLGVSDNDRQSGSWLIYFCAFQQMTKLEVRVHKYEDVNENYRKTQNRNKRKSGRWGWGGATSPFSLRSCMQLRKTPDIGRDVCLRSLIIKRYNCFNAAIFIIFLENTRMNK